MTIDTKFSGTLHGFRENASGATGESPLQAATAKRRTNQRFILNRTCHSGRPARTIVVHADVTACL
jgi:hypothetical protein